MDLTELQTRITACRLCADRFKATVTGHEPRPVAWLSDEAPILIAGQAPGARVHESGRPFTDPSGERLRDWLGVSEAEFYDRRNFAILPMAFCFPGYDAKGADLPPPAICARTWRDTAMAAMSNVKLHLLVGGHAQGWHLGTKGVTATVLDWRAHTPGALPLPHPSWRNTGWLKRNPWFADDLLPWLRSRVRHLLEVRT